MTEYDRHRVQETNPEFIPLTGMSEYEHDITDEVLPPAYGDHYTDPQPFTQPRVEPRPPVGFMGIQTAEDKKKVLRTIVRARCCLLFAMCGCLFLPGLAFLIAGIVAYQLLSFHFANFRGVTFVHALKAPKPPVALFFTPNSEGQFQFIWTTAVGAALVAYPAAMFVVEFSRRFLCGRRSREVTRRMAGPAPVLSTAQRRLNNTLVCGVALLFAAPIIAGLILTILLAHHNITQANDVYLVDDVWADQYVIFHPVSNGSSASLFSSENLSLGNVLFTQTSVGWSMQIPGSQSSLQHVVYSNPILNTSPSTVSQPIQFNASCASNTTDHCLTGGMASQPTPYNEDLGFYCQPNSVDENGNCVRLYPDFGGDINLFLSPSSNATNIWTSYDNYQGIGKSFGPLGYWYCDTSPCLQVAWITTSAEGNPCEGLEIYLSKEYEEASWIVLGLVWNWWITWVQHNYENSYSSSACNWGSLQQISDY